MSLELYLFFLVTTVMLILVPGPAAIAVASQGASSNSKNAFLCLFGVAIADVFFFVLSATGIASLVVASNLLFSIIKWLGVLYLVYLGISAIFSKSGAIQINTQAVNKGPVKAFSQGLVIQLANPKALMYFSALLPQFIDTNEPIVFQMLIMGVSCFVADILAYSMFAYLGSRLAKHQVKAWVVNIINKFSGLALITTGIRMATLENTK
jgi:homoserine/homoserine lactone efflux protein